MHKCDDAYCAMPHPICRQGDDCTNLKCGFLHPSGRRYTGTMTNYSDPVPGRKTQRQVGQKTAPIAFQGGQICHNAKNCGPSSGTIGTRTCDIETNASNSLQYSLPTKKHLDEMAEARKRLEEKRSSTISSVKSKTNSLLQLHEYGKSIKAKGEITQIDERRETAWLRLASYCFAKHPEFEAAATNSPSGTRMNMQTRAEHQENNIFQSLAIGDRLSVEVCLDHEQNIVAYNPRYIKFNAGSRSCDELVKIVNMAISGVTIHENLLVQILNLDGASHLVVEAVLIRTHPIWTNYSQILKARRLSAIFIQKSSFLKPEGSLCIQMHMLSMEALWAAHDMIGSICVLNMEDTYLLVHAASILAQRAGGAAISLLTGMLQATSTTCLLRNSCNSLECLSWWQLPSVPLVQDIISFTDACGITDLKSLPSVLLDKAYPNVETYISTYMRLHRADCFITFISQLKQDFHDQNGTNIEKKKSPENLDTELVVCDGIVVCAMHVNNKSGEMNIQLGCKVEDPNKLRHNTFALTNMICISLQGDFRDQNLIWGVITVAPMQRGFAINDTKTTSVLRSCRVVFSVQWCSKVNIISDEQVMGTLQDHQDTAQLVENPISFVSFEPVLDALRSLWRPGSPITLPFKDSLLKGKSMPATDEAKFLKIGNRLGIPAELDNFQLEAYNHVAKNKLALIQGPPGCGKSYVGSRLSKVLAETYGRILVVTFKNHALDEMLLDITNLNGGDLSRIIRCGNNKKISNDLKLWSLQALMNRETWSSKETTDSSHSLHILANKCNSKCQQLQKEIRLTSVNFAEATGSSGVYAVNMSLGRKCEFGQKTFANDSLESKETVDRFLQAWALPALNYLKQESKAYWKSISSVGEGGHDLDIEQQVWAAEQDQGKETVTDFEGFAETDPSSLMGVMIAFGASKRSITEDLPDMDISTMNSWGAESKSFFLLSVLRRQFHQLTNSFADLARQLNLLQEDAKFKRFTDEVRALRSVPVIGSTILGVLLNMDAISAAEPRVLLMEEAGEVPEATLISILRIPSLERCVMIGDHQQLRPAINSHQLRVHKNLDISCFERLVRLGIPKIILKTQNRMCTDVLLPVLQHYPGIVSNEKVIRHLHPVAWLICPLFWWICEERGVQQHASWYNEEQGQQAAKLASFLVDQGAAEKEQITILVPYTSQLFYVRMLLRRNGNAEVNVSTIDQYQGDENDIIILSLVRCDPDNPGKLGFLGEVNRMIVATSRQKRALIIIGSESCFSTSPEWKALQDALKKSKSSSEVARISCKLPICCPRHKNKILLVPDSHNFPLSGCGEGCKMKLLNCAHKCSLSCHPAGKAHGQCKQIVQHSHCPCKHTFQYQCHAIPKECPKEVQITLNKCGHKYILPCGKLGKLNFEDIICNETCEIILPCEHAVWVRCGSNAEGYISPEFNACPECILHSLHIGSDQNSIEMLSKKCGPRTPISQYNLDDEITAEQCTLISDAVTRAGLCDGKDASLVQEALRRAKVPSAFVNYALPNPILWDPYTHSESRRQHLETFSTQQHLWRVLLQESGVVVPLKWQKQPLVLLAGIALACVENRRVAPSRDATDAQKLFSQLQILNKGGINSSEDFIAIIKKAGERLYKCLFESDNISYNSWYGIEEGKLARTITSHLIAGTAAYVQSQHSTSSKSEFDPLKILNQLSNPEMQSSLNSLRVKWGMSDELRGDLHAPPYQEVPHDFLYRSSHAGSTYISIDLRNADFHVLRLAAPALIEQNEWSSWVKKVIPDLVKRIPFLAEMKPLRVRVLGKTLHKKNVALQCHCIRILARLLLGMAKVYEKEFSNIDRVFQFSCDELCIKLKVQTTRQAASDLSVKVSQCIENMGWQGLLPVRVELFQLSRMPMPENVPFDKFEDFDENIEIATIHAGHPALRESVQFVDLPGVHDPVWEKRSLPPLSTSERCDGSYFVRRIKKWDHVELQFKKLPRQLRPYVTLEHMRTDLQGDKGSKGIDQISENATEFVPKITPSPSLQTRVGSLMSSDAPEFIPSKSKGTGQTGKSVPKSYRIQTDIQIAPVEVGSELSPEATEFIPGSVISSNDLAK